MKFFKVIAKHLLLFAFISITTLFVAVGAVTYYVLNHIHDESDNNHNLHEVMKIGESYVAELDSFAGLEKVLQNKTMPPFCKTLCNPSSISQEMLLNQRTPYLTEFYNATGSKAFQDPMFRFKIWQMNSVSRAVPVSVREILKDVLNKETLTTKNKVLLALQVETVLLTNLPSMPSRMDAFLADSERQNQARTWIKACQMGGNSKKIMAECEAEFRPVIK
jgi:hypothetical protein